MIAPAFLALILAVAQDAPPPGSWAAGLASAKAEERFATIDAIEARGLSALPALREIAANGAGEARPRATDLIERIGARRLLRATPVSFDKENATVAAFAARLSDASRFPVELEPAAEAASGRGVALDPGREIGFFEALDLLASRGGLRLDPSPSYRSPARSGVRVRLAAREGEMPPASFAGPYRVGVIGLERRREVVQARKPQDESVRETTSVLLEVVAEPGVMIDRNGPIRLQEATDERGRDLLPPSTLDPAPSPGPHRPWSQDALGTFGYRLPLKLPEDRGRKVARLRGFVPITAIGRTDELFSGAFAGLEGKTLSGGGVSMRVARVPATGNAGALEVTIRGETPPDLSTFAAGPRQTTLATLRLGFNLDDHVRIEDADGVPFTTNSNGTAPPSPDGSLAYRINFYPGRAMGPPAKIRYFGVAGVATEIPFDFRDLPMP